MQYQEKKTDTGYEYYGAGVFGDMELTSSEQLTGDQLDGILSIMMKQGSSAQIVEGTVKITDDHKVFYKFTKNLQWGDETIDTCEDTHTSIQKMVKEFIVTNFLKVPVLSWLVQFVAAFRKAWKNAKK